MRTGSGLQVLKGYLLPALKTYNYIHLIQGTEPQEDQGAQYRGPGSETLVSSRAGAIWVGSLQ